MALIACHECGAKVSAAAKTCPSCGVKPKKPTSKTTWIIGGVALSAILISLANAPSEQAAAPPALHMYEPPEIAAELSRIRAISPLEFCTKELRKLATGDQTPAWAAAISKIAPEYGITPSDLKAVAQRNHSIGMSACSAYAVWGFPEDINTTTFSGGTREQWVYGGGRYVHLMNGQVTSVSH